MKEALIDIGSNSMRLTLYNVHEEEFKVLFKQKYMAGLAGYVEKRKLTQEGIQRACRGLVDFRGTLEALGIKKTKVFATASLRNIENTEEAVDAIREATGYRVEVISGRQEAEYGYIGAMMGLGVQKGSYVDIGGASTEVAEYQDGRMINTASFKVGSLNLYKRYVKNIVPGPGSIRRIDDAIQDKIEHGTDFEFAHFSPLVATGGTSRAVLKVARVYFGLPDQEMIMSRRQLDELCGFFRKGGTPVKNMILRIEPERIHTMVPGAMILQHVAAAFDAQQIIVSQNGVREGYLCRKILKK